MLNQRMGKGTLGRGIWGSMARSGNGVREETSAAAAAAAAGGGGGGGKEGEGEGEGERKHESTAPAALNRDSEQNFELGEKQGTVVIKVWR
jgi:hypothetical protein